MQILAVGQQYDPSIKEWPEGCHYNYDLGGHWLHYFYQVPSDIEINSIQAGPARFGLFIEEPVIFLLHQFGDMPWNDAPYSWWLVTEEYRRLPQFTPGEHAFLRVVLIDTSTGIVAALRALTFSPAFTQKLHEAILRQAESPWSPSRHDEVIRSVYSRFTAHELVQRAQILCRGGD